MKKVVQLIRLSDKVKIPSYSTPGSAAVNLQANIEVPITIRPGRATLIPTGIKVHINNPTIAAHILPRSGKGNKGYGVKNLTGLIDSDYQGEIFIGIWNTNNEVLDAQDIANGDYGDITINPLDEIAQLEFVNVLQVAFDDVKEFVAGATARGEGGFGHTDGLTVQEVGRVERHEHAVNSPVQLDWTEESTLQKAWREEKAWREGTIAGNAGFRKTDNPYSAGTEEAQHWEDARYMCDHSTTLKRGE